MPADDIIVIGPGPKVRSNASNEETAARLREVADMLDSGEMDVEPTEATE